MTHFQCCLELQTYSHMFCLIKGWLVDEDSRPDFKTLVDEITEMARDPGRYLLIQVGLPFYTSWLKRQSPF